MKFLTNFFIIFLTGFSIQVFSQLCGGTFGAPIFLETFGTVNSPVQVISPPLTYPASTSYNFRSVFPPNDGEYTISNTTEYLSWGWQKSLDHTIDASGTYGNMLVVNASYTPGEFYRRRVSNLCPNQIYRFSAWVLNLHRAGSNVIKPNVTFQIQSTSGVVLGTVSTGNLQEESTEVWKNFYLDFKSDSSSPQVEVVLINNAPGGMGNDLAIDDISFSPCGPATSITASLPEIFTSGICNPSQEITLSAQMSSNTFANVNFIWQKSSDGGNTWANITSETNNPNLIVSAGTYQNNDRFRFIVGEAANINLSTCRVFSDAAVFKIKSAPPAPDAKTFNFCQYSSGNSISTNGSNLMWYDSASAVIGSPSAPLVDTNEVKTYNYWVSQIIDGCESSRAQVTVNVIAAPNPPTVTNFRFCQNTPASALWATGSDLLWYSASSGGLGSPTAPVPDTFSAGLFSYWVSQKVNGCESRRVEVKVEILPKPFSNSLKDASICDGEKIDLDAGLGFVSYEWQTSPPIFAQRLEVTSPGKYSVKLTDSKGCTALQTVEVTPGVTPDIIRINSGEDFLEIFAEGGNPPYLYSIDLINWQKKNIFYGLKAGIYQVYVKSETNSCTAVAKSAVLFVPNAFTPNQDAINDVWRVSHIEYFSKAKLKIFDRFGAEVFYTDDISRFEWNGFSSGRPLPTGVYWYVIELENQQARAGWILLKNRN